MSQFIAHKNEVDFKVEDEISEPSEHNVTHENEDAKNTDAE
jgi:hypothetical protein